MSYGEIYKSTWWGETVSGGFGEAYRNLIGDERFIISVKTDNLGTSTSTQFTLPWFGTYDVDWGDGTVEEGVVDSQTHTYSSAGTYDVAITAATGSIAFNGGGDRRKLLDIKNWGAVSWTTMDVAFRGCENTIVSAEDALVLPADCARMLQSCSSLTTLDVSNWDTSSVTAMNAMFSNCFSLTTLDVSGWDSSSVTNMSFMFFNCSFLKADLSGLDIASAANLSSFAIGTQINEEDGLGNQITTNYDNTLISWAAQTPVSGRNVHFGTAQYSLGGAAEAARTTLVTTYLWTITDGGGV